MRTWWLLVSRSENVFVQKCVDNYYFDTVLTVVSRLALSMPTEEMKETNNTHNFVALFVL